MGLGCDGSEVNQHLAYPLFQMEAELFFVDLCARRSSSLCDGMRAQKRTGQEGQFAAATMAGRRRRQGRAPVKREGSQG